MTPEDTFNKLKRLPVQELNKQLDEVWLDAYAASFSGDFESPMHHAEYWARTRSETIVKAGWTVKEYDSRKR